MTMLSIETYDWRSRSGARIFRFMVRRNISVARNREYHMKNAAFASAASPSSTRSIAASLRGVMGALGRGVVAVVDGFIEGHRLQTQVLSQRGRYYIQD